MLVSITFHSVSGLPKHDMLMNKTDPFIEASYGTASAFHTQVREDSGSEATFEETWTFDAQEPLETITLKIKESKHIRSDELLCHGTFSFELKSGYLFSGPVPLITEKHCKNPIARITCRVGDA